MATILPYLFFSLHHSCYLSATLYKGKSSLSRRNGSSFANRSADWRTAAPFNRPFFSPLFPYLSSPPPLSLSFSPSLLLSARERIPTFPLFYNGRKNGSSVLFYSVNVSQFKCCGALRFEDWVVSEWHKDENVLKNGSLVPDSCCKTPTLLCGRRDHPSNIHYTVSIDFQPVNIFANIIVTLLDLKRRKIVYEYRIMNRSTREINKDSIQSIIQGCIYKFLETTKDHLIILGAVGLGLSVLELFGIVLGSCLYIKLRHDFDDWELLQTLESNNNGRSWCRYMQNGAGAVWSLGWKERKRERRGSGRREEEEGGRNPSSPFTISCFSFFHVEFPFDQRDSWNFYSILSLFRRTTAKKKRERKGEGGSRKRGKMKEKRCDIRYSLATGIFKVRLLFSLFFLFFFIQYKREIRDKKSRSQDEFIRYNGSPISPPLSGW